MWIIIAIDDHADVINQYESMITTGIVGDITEMDLLECGRYWELRHSRYRNR